MTPAQTIKLSAAKQTFDLLANGAPPKASAAFRDLLDIIAQLDLEAAQAKQEAQNNSDLLIEARRQISDYTNRADTVSPVYRLLDPKELTQEGDEHVYSSYSSNGNFEVCWSKTPPALPASRYIAVRRALADEGSALRAQAEKFHKLDDAFSRIAALARKVRPQVVNWDNKTPDWLVRTVEAQYTYLEKRKEFYKAAFYATTYPGAQVRIGDKTYEVLEGQKTRVANFPSRQCGKSQFAKTVGEQEAITDLDKIESLLKGYGWPARADGRTMIEHLSALLTTFTHQGGVIEGLKHRRAETPLMSFARSASTEKTEESVAKLHERLDTFSAALREGQMSLDKLTERLGHQRVVTLHGITDAVLISAIISDALKPIGLSYETLNWGLGNILDGKTNTFTITARLE